MQTYCFTKPKNKGETKLLSTKNQAPRTMIEIFKQVLVKHKASKINLLRVDGFVTVDHFSKATEELGPKNELVDKLQRGLVKILFVEEGFQTIAAKQETNGVLRLEVNRGTMTVYFNGEIDCSIALEFEKSVGKRISEMLLSLPNLDVITNEQASELTKLGYEAAMELHLINHSITKGTAAYEAFKIGLRKGMKEIAHGI